MTDRSQKLLHGEIIPPGVGYETRIIVETEDHRDDNHVYIELGDMKDDSAVVDGRLGWWITTDQAHQMIVALAEAIAHQTPDPPEVNP